MQTPWLTAFLQDPHMIRPAAQLRMPRFHYGKDEKMPGDGDRLAGQLFRRAGPGEFPYQSIPEQTPSYLAERNKDHPDYLGAGWTMMTNKASPCLQCHAIGQFKPSGGATVVNGPDLREVAARFRPSYLEAWIANPSRMLPVHGHASEHRAAWRRTDPSAQGVRKQADRNGAGRSRHAA